MSDPPPHPTLIKSDAGCLWSTMTVHSFLINYYLSKFLSDIEGNLTHFQKNCQLQKNQQKKITDNSTIQKLPFVICLSQIDIFVLLVSFLYTRTYKYKYIYTHNIYIYLYITQVYILVTYIKSNFHIILSIFL